MLHRVETGDRDLLAGIRAGDKAALHEIVERHAGPLWGTLRRALANPEDAREAFQETWARALSRLDTLREPDRFRSWLVSIALNLVRQGGRSRAPLLRSPEVLDGRVDEGARPAEEVVESAETAARLRERIAELPARQREVMDLRMNHELSYADIAEALGIREDAARASYYQALRKLRAQFTEPDDERPTDQGPSR